MERENGKSYLCLEDFEWVDRESIFETDRHRPYTYGNVVIEYDCKSILRYFIDTKLYCHGTDSMIDWCMMEIRKLKLNRIKEKI